MTISEALLSHLPGRMIMTPIPQAAPESVQHYASINADRNEVSGNEDFEYR
ncbi:hypothetical protein [Paenibacillus sp. JSM ZJ436]|uniref:hypothetical protein n=1 Tax=Paenibacillus sp. JSM ZJ436 TaxID=3376190 RepID=UPI0037CAD5BF